MSQTGSGVQVGKLSDRVEVLEFQNVSEPGTPTAWEWETVRRTWAQAELTAKTNI